MSRIAFLFRTDVHLADKNPESWKGNYQEEVWESLEQIGVLAKKYDVKAVLDGGDYFHVKSSTRNSHSLVAHSAEVQAKYPCPTYVVPGNHDIAYNNLDTLDQQQPLRVLFATKVFQRLTEATFESEGRTVRVVGVPYSLTRKLEDLRDIKKGSEDHLIVIAHLLAGENPPANSEDFFGEPVFKYADLCQEGGPDFFCFGHWHKDQGIVKVKDQYFVNPGAVSRGSLAKENLQRTPQVALIEFVDGKISVGLIPLRLPPAEDVFDLEKKDRRDREAAAINKFAERLSKEVTEAPVQDIESSIRSLNFAPEVVACSLNYLELARNS
jgi:DNA repair protein SbcD/Mre11